jgi:hypothetical protein
MFFKNLMLPLCGALSTFVSLDLDVAQEYLPLLTQQLDEEENKATSRRLFIPFYVFQRTIHYKTAGDCCGKLEYCYITRQRNYVLD